MGGEWRKYTVRDLFDLKPGFAFKSSDFMDSGVPVIKIKNVKANSVVLNDRSYVDERFLDTKKDYIVNHGDILITMSGNRFDGSRETWVGKVAQFLSSETCLLNQRVAILRPKAGGQVDQRCCSYILGSDSYQDLFIAIATSSGGQANLSPGQILGAEIILPPLTEQQAIACILGALDDKIELNRRMDRTLEAMARAIFKSWFVDFDPVRAKAEGQQPPGLASRIADLFPDGFEESELGVIPRGWSASNVGQHFRLTMGQSPPGSTYNEIGDGLPFYQGRTDFGFRFPSRRAFCTAPTRFAEPGDTLVSVRAPVGDVNMASERCAVGRGVAAIRHRGGGRSFTYYSMHDLGDHFGKFEAEGTVFGCINKADFERLPFVVVPTELLGGFDRVVSPLDDRIETNERQSATLAKLRDALLPKLIAGELRVPDAERIVDRCE